MSGFYYRTESIKKEELVSLFVESEIEREIINNFKSKSIIKITYFLRIF